MWKAAFPTAAVKRHVEKRVLNTHPLHLFRIIQDVDAYQDFLPYCSKSEVLRSSADGRSFDGLLRIGYPPVFSEEYVSRVTVIPEELTINATSIRSRLFEKLESRWALQSASDDDRIHSCNVYFEVAITVSNPIITQALDRVLGKIAVGQVEAFEQRCSDIQYSPELLAAIGQSDAHAEEACNRSAQ